MEAKDQTVRVERCSYGRTMAKFLIKKGFEIGKIDYTLFTKRVDGEQFVCQIFVDVIIVGSTNPRFSFCLLLALMWKKR